MRVASVVIILLLAVGVFSVYMYTSSVPLKPPKLSKLPTSKLSHANHRRMNQKGPRHANHRRMNQKGPRNPIQGNSIVSQALRKQPIKSKTP